MALSEKSEEVNGTNSQRTTVRVPFLLLGLLLMVAGIQLVALSFLRSDNFTGVIFIFPLPFLIIGGRLDPLFLFAVAALMLAFPLLIFYFLVRKMSHE